jgi:anaerobic magnesium-protoporphyrin IX monomethyl ester cyclase
MRVLLVNVPHPAIGSRCSGEHLPPLGLLAIAGPLIDAGHDVELLDAEPDNLPLAEIVRRALASRPQAVLFGHSGSTSAHPVVAEASRRLRSALPSAWLVYGGVFPTYHWREILVAEPQIDVIVRGEGEATTPRLIAALAAGSPLGAIPGLAFRDAGVPVATPPVAMIEDLNACRIAWELLDFARYSYWGGRRAAVIQFSRGCPHRCSYCGQRGFWTRWRHRDPKAFAAEIAMLHRRWGVTVVDLADENPTTSKRLWREFLEALIAEDVPVMMLATIRADDIVRDADILHLYQRAGMTRILLGLDSTDPATLRAVRKGGAPATDRRAIELLRQHGILSMVSSVAGLAEERDRDYWRNLRRLLAYDPDLVQCFYATPHGWTPHAQAAGDRQVIEPDLRHWDYRHQVLATPHVPPWRVFLWLKLTELAVQLRPRALWRLLQLPDRRARSVLRWHYAVARRVFVREIRDFLLRDRRRADGPRLNAFWGSPPDFGEAALSRQVRRSPAAKSRRNRLPQRKLISSPRPDRQGAARADVAGSVRP